MKRAKKETSMLEDINRPRYTEMFPIEILYSFTHLVVILLFGNQGRRS